MKTTLPQPIRDALAKALNYPNESDLYYWGTGGAIDQFERGCEYLAEAMGPEPLKHSPDCDTQDRNLEGIAKPCNCPEGANP